MFTFDLHFEIFLFLLIVIAGVIFAVEIKGHIFSYYNFVMHVSFAAYMLLLFKATICPITIGAEVFLNREFDLNDCIQCIPFASIKKLIQYKNWYQLLGNIFLLMPLPAYLQLFSGDHKIDRKKMTLKLVSASIGIEVIQLFIDYVSRYKNHVMDIDDVILNICGGIIIVIFIKPICQIIKRLFLYEHSRC